MNLRVIGLLVWVCGVTAGAGGGMAQSGTGLEEYEQPTPSDGWIRQKCDLYGHVFRDALTAQGHDGLSNRFLSANQRFIDAECQGPRTLCPISPAELEFADLLTMMTMNEGMASTFVPFGCPG